MMAHRTEDILLAYVDGELPDRERTSVQAHLSSCPDCVARLEMLRARSARLSRALVAADRPPPGANPAGTPAGGRSGRHPVASPLLKVAAALLLVAVGAAAAVPGSPVQRWIKRSVQEARTLLGGHAAPGGAAQAEPGAADASGVAVGMAEGSVRVLVIDPNPETVLHVRLVDGDQAAVSGVGGHFSTGPGWVEVRATGPGSLWIDLPESARSARVELQGRTVVQKDGPTLSLLSGDSVVRTGRELQFRARP